MSQISTDDGGTGIQEHYLTPGEVAVLYRVDPKTVSRWAASGRRRFPESVIRERLRPAPQAGAVPDHPGPSPVEVR